MYSSVQLAKKYLRYYFTASSGKGHGIHSPFVFDFIKFVLNDTAIYPCYNSIELLRKKLLHDCSVIKIEDFGAGSAVIKTENRIVKKIAGSSLKSKKFSRLLFRVVQYYKPAVIVELGTSFGTTAAYMASANPQATVYTLEGASSIAAMAKEHFQQLSLNNVKLLEADFDYTIPLVLKSVPAIDLVFIDGNHTKQATLKYFRQFLNNSTFSTILIFDDIHWSVDMEEAWRQIQQDNAVTLTIDLFFIGLVFINPDFKVKQHFTIRF